MKCIDVFQADYKGFLLFQTVANELALAPGVFNRPYLSYDERPHEAPPGMVNRRNLPINDAWVLVEDHRDDVLYYVVAPATEEKPAVIAQYHLDQLVEVDGVQVSYDGGGPIPYWLTDVAPVPAPAPAPEQLT
ncbi:phage tail protein [Herminiimonas contaminans]|uniref:Phage tail protein n=1 Tax=Herminiimonas contaminans TaxID=1111140 RepID=A0ABS0EQC9_9BURK|nr:phage tail protein [Herminiimonas contaminans]MBF8176930.1 phage tail protein [Herminiimonas contaminans]